MTTAQLAALVAAVFGPRGTRQYTSGLGAIGGYDSALIGVRQGSPLGIASIAGRPDLTHIVDARDNEMLISKLKNVTEWTGYHAEMMILRAILNTCKIKPGLYRNVAGELAQYGGVNIAADAPCCHHCGSMLDALGVGYPGVKGARGRTGWWNPLTDTVYGNGTAEFQKDIPGS